MHADCARRKNTLTEAGAEQLSRVSLTRFSPGCASARFHPRLASLSPGLVHILNCAVVDLFLGYGSQAVLPPFPRAAKAVSRFSGVAMIVIALALLIERLGS